MITQPYSKNTIVQPDDKIEFEEKEYFGLEKKVRLESDGRPIINIKSKNDTAIETAEEIMFDIAIIIFACADWHEKNTRGEKRDFPGRYWCKPFYDCITWDTAIEITNYEEKELNLSSGSVLRSKDKKMITLNQFIKKKTSQ